MQKLEKRLKIKFKKKKLLKRALTHRSYLNETKKSIHSNERLEFLGDAVLELIVSDYLFEEYNTLSEGKLTNLRSAIVKTETLAQAAKKLALGETLLLSRGEELGGGRENSSLMANTFEAVLGAIYLDQGINKAKQLVQDHLLTKLPAIIKAKTYIDFKSKLQAVIQEREKVTPTYEVIKETGPDHDKTFFINCKVGERTIGKGSGKSKQQAEQQAAKDALQKIEHTW